MRQAWLYSIGMAVLGHVTTFGSVAHGQKRVDVLYEHTADPRPETVRLFVRKAGMDSTRWVPIDNGERLTVPQGGRICYSIRGANPLLYSYTTAAEAITVAPPEGFDIVLTAIGGLTMNAFDRAPDQSLLRAYSEHLEKLRLTMQALETERLVDAVNWPRHMQKKDSLLREAVADSTKASVANQAAKASADTLVIRQLAALQQVTMQRVRALAAEFDDADKRMRQQLCTTIDKDRVRVSLSIMPRLQEKKEPGRAIADNIASVEADPQSDIAFDVAAGVMLGPKVPRTKFSMKDGVVAATPDEDPIVHPGVFALGRLWPMAWLWAGIGATKGKEATPDLFFGIVARPGLSLAGPQLSVGVGLGLFDVPIGLKNGGVGLPLPENVSDIDKILDRRYRSGVGVTFSLSGLQLGSK